MDEENAVLAEIRAVNDSIEDAALSAQIDRIGVITAKIFEYQKSHPERSAQLHAFLSYYLPTTLKILRAYAQLESQGVEGENIAAAMSRIEGMMGKVVEGFEKQLDQLFQGDAMDITTDVAVLEHIEFTPEQKERAASVDLEEFLLRQGEKLIKSGREKRLASDHSVTVTGCEWFDHASNEGGRAVSFVQKFYSKNYCDSANPK